MNSTNDITIHLVYYLQPYAGNNESVVVRCRTVKECLDTLVNTYPELQKMLFEDKGELRDYVSIFVGDEIVYANGLERPVKPGDHLHVLYIIGGG